MIYLGGVLRIAKKFPNKWPQGVIFPVISCTKKQFWFTMTDKQISKPFPFLFSITNQWIVTSTSDIGILPWREWRKETRGGSQTDTHKCTVTDRGTCRDKSSCRGDTVTETGM